ncbi:kinase-like domain-containing protein [Lipomyces arxii]|uniref:kinase-like domain-containing protein n=1 Tax=Lipomyces arxii TaxID=56418 RepID=UPI0034CEEFF0
MDEHLQPPDRPSTRQPLVHLTLGLARLYASIQHKGITELPVPSPIRVDANERSMGRTPPKLLTPSRTLARNGRLEDLLVNRYKVVHVLGTGAFGTTLLVEDVVCKKRVAVKKLVKKYTQIGVHESRVLIELRRIRSRHFVDFYTSFYSDGCLHLAMEWLDASRPVRLPRCEHTFGHNSLTCPDRIYAFAMVAVQLLTGLHELHELGWIHADLKPDNMLFSPQQESGYFRIKIIDFGNSTKVSSTYLYHSDYEIQSIAYRAPEVFVGDKGFDERIDVWSVGMILLELLLDGVYGVESNDIKIVKGETRLDVINLLKKWFGSLECYRPTADLWLDEFGDAILQEMSEPQTRTPPVKVETVQSPITPTSARKRRQNGNGKITREYVRRRRKREPSSSAKREPSSRKTRSTKSNVYVDVRDVKPKIHLTSEMLLMSQSPPVRLLSTSPPTMSSVSGSPFGRLVEDEIGDAIVVQTAATTTPPVVLPKVVVKQEQTVLQQLLSDPRRADLAKFLHRLLTVDFRSRPSAKEAARDDLLVKEILGTWGDILVRQ